MKEIIIVIDVLAAVGIITLVLFQQGKGADMGAAFGGGTSASLFGARGSANFLSRTTAVLATVFFVANLTLAWISAREVGPKSVTQTVTEPAKVEKDVPPAPPGAASPDVPPAPPVAPK